MLARSDFENAVKQALRHYTQADLLAENALLRSPLLTNSKPGAATPQALRALLAETAKALFAGERDQRLYHVLDLTYLNPAPKQETAANRLGLSYSTYRRHLTTGVDRLTEWLWKQELEAQRVETVAEQTTGSATAGEELSVQSQRPRLSIVVLPFLNLSQDSSVASLVDGIGDGLITDLSRALPGSFVVSRSTAFTYKDRQVPVPQVAQELGVRYVLEGSVLVDPRRIRVNVQLIDALTDEHVWAERFDRDRKDTLEAHDEIVGRLSRSVGIEMVCKEATRGSAGNSADVIDLVMRARELANDIRQRENGASAVELFRQALQLDPDRQKLLAAMAALCEKPALASEKITAITPATTKEITADSSSSSAERRQLTVMFCDLVGSTALSARLDPEDLSEVIAAYHRAAAEVVAGFDGFVAKYMGDGVLVYFGYPRAHEDDAERAVRAGLSLIDAVGRLDVKSVKLQARVGIATGLVVVGDLFGEISGHEQSVVGETPNLAARLQALAEPDAVVVAASTRQLVGELFEYRDLGDVEVKGLAEPVPAWRILQPSVVASRFEALRGSSLTPLVGRDEEIGMLLRRWAQARAGEGRVALLSAEPGIGKSRLTEAIEERISTEPHHRLRYFCSPHHQDSALYPIISNLERAADFARHDDAGTRRHKLAEMLAADRMDAADLTLIADLLSLPGPDPPLDLTPQQRKERTLDALLRRLEGLARQLPVLMVFEDLHWMDPTSRELLDRTIARVEHLPVLLTATSRPEFQPPWIDHPHVTMLTLSRLGRREGEILVRGLAGNKTALPADIVEEIVERADGVPLFLEEVTKVVLEAKATAARRALAAVPDARAAVPATLQASLMARLDRLGPAAREIAQTGAAIGREFPYELLARVSLRSEVETRGALDQLTAAGLVFQHGTPPTAEYQFKHALVQDTAYGTLLRGPRRALHGRIAAAMQQHSPEIVERRPETLAHHLTEAGDLDSAASYWLEAGRRASSRSAIIEAASHLTRGIATLRGLTETTERSRQELATQLVLGAVLLSKQGYGAPEVREAYRRAGELAQRLDDNPSMFAATWGMWITAEGLGGREQANNRLRHLGELIEIAERIGDPELSLQAHHSAWSTFIWHGQYVRGQEHIRQGLAIYDPDKHRHHALMYGGHDPGVCGKGQNALALWALGYPDQAHQSSGESAALAEKRGHLPSFLHSLWLAGVLYLLRRDITAARDCGARLLALGQEHRLPQYQAVGGTLHFWALARLGGGEEAVAEMRSYLQRWGTIAKLMSDALGVGLAELELHFGNFGQAAAALTEAENAGTGWWRSDILRVRGDLQRLQSGEGDRSPEQLYMEAISIAQSRQARSFELRSATALARFWAEQGRRGESRDLLAPIYNWFTEGFDTPDLKEAKALLDELGGTG